MRKEYNYKVECEIRQSYLDCSGGVVRVPLSSAGTRKLSKRARGSSRGGIPYLSPKFQKYITLKTESHLEGSALFVAMADPNVVHIWDQPTAVKYIDEKGRSAEYTADARIEYKCGRKALVEVKPFAIAQKQRTREKLANIARFVSPDFADGVKLFTDKSCPRWFINDAMRLYEFNKHPDFEADEAIRHAIDGLKGEVTLRSLAKMTGLEGRGFRAAFRAVFRDELKRSKARGLKPDSFVFRWEVKP